MMEYCLESDFPHYCGTFQRKRSPVHYYDVFPRVVPSDKVTQVRIRPRFSQADFPEASQLNVYSIPVDGEYPGASHRNYTWSEKSHQPVEWRIESGELIVSGHFAGEQEHIIVARISDSASQQKNFERQFHIYSVADDLYELRPLKGDFHIHSTGSDGLECPAFVAARYRQRGFDFIAVSDHGQYAPSLEAIEYWKPFNLDFRLYPGEEVHSPGNPVHIINFGATRSVHSLAHDNEEQYRCEVEEIRATLPENDRDFDNFPVAASEWVFDRIREHGGLAVFCHPYWYMMQNVICNALSDAIFKRRKFDALEVIGGFYKSQSRSNNLQVVRWVEEQAGGNRFPVVGLSDSHGTTMFTCGRDKCFTEGHDRDLFDCNFTILLARDNSVAAISEAVREYRSVAVCRYLGELPMLYGDHRMVKYSDFLLRHYFPLQTEICEIEGSLMLAHLSGDVQAKSALAALAGRAVALKQKSFGD